MSSSARRSSSSRVVCAWCRVVLHEGASADLVSHGMCPSCFGAIWKLEIEDVLSMTPEQADRLPWGLIRLRGDGEVVLYNAAESKLSGLAGQDVLGKNFFRDVAPCTCVREFQGRLADRREAAQSGADEFEFIFRFPGDPMVVSIRLIYAADTDTAAVIVQRLD